MLTRGFAWGVIALAVIGGAWWYLDPVGFEGNPVLSWLHDLTLRSEGYHR
jgi:hypothetical protein